MTTTEYHIEWKPVAPRHVGGSVSSSAVTVASAQPPAGPVGGIEIKIVDGACDVYVVGSAGSSRLRVVRGRIGERGRREGGRREQHEHGYPAAHHAHLHLSVVVTAGLLPDTPDHVSETADQTEEEHGS